MRVNRSLDLRSTESMSASPTPIPYRLRIEHEGMAGLRLLRKGRTLRIDPIGEIAPNDIVILTAPDHERLQTTGRTSNITTVAPPEILDWLGGRTSIEAHQPPAEIDGVRIELIPYQPQPYTLREFGAVLQGLSLRPVRSAQRLWRRIEAADCDPHILILTFPDDSKLVRLGLSLHRATPMDWLRDIQARVTGAEWLLLDVPYGEDDAVLGHLAGFEVERIIFTDISAEKRRHLGRPTQMLTPTVDRAISQGMDGYVCISQASFRFD